MESLKRSSKTRLSINLSADIERQLRFIQADMIANTNAHSSFSSVIEMLLREALRERKKRNLVVSEETRKFLSSQI